LGELTRLKSETLAHPDHIAKLPCILSTQEIAKWIEAGKKSPRSGRARLQPCR
jgi:hypothetical protein